MALVVVVVAVAVLVALGLRRRWSGAVLRAPLLALAAAACQAAGALAGGRAYVAGLAGSAVLAAGFLALNRRTRGIGLVALGLAANALVVALNGAMPVSLSAAQRARADVAPVLLGLDARHELVGPATHLRLLGDVVPVPMPVAPEVVSPGDVLVAAGLAQLVLSLTRSRGRARGPAPRRGAGRLPVRPGA